VIIYSLHASVQPVRMSFIHLKEVFSTSKSRHRRRGGTKRLL